jgi:hypothetical protein
MTQHAKIYLELLNKPYCVLLLYFMSNDNLAYSKLDSTAKFPGKPSTSRLTIELRTSRGLSLPDPTPYPTFFHRFSSVHLHITSQYAPQEAVDVRLINLNS